MPVWARTPRRDWRSSRRCLRWPMLAAGRGSMRRERLAARVIGRVQGVGLPLVGASPGRRARPGGVGDERGRRAIGRARGGGRADGPRGAGAAAATRGRRERASRRSRPATWRRAASTTASGSSARELARHRLRGAGGRRLHPARGLRHLAGRRAAGLPDHASLRAGLLPAGRRSDRPADPRRHRGAPGASGYASFGLARWEVWVEPGRAPAASGDVLPQRIVLACGDGTYQAYQRGTE